MLMWMPKTYNPGWGGGRFQNSKASVAHSHRERALNGREGSVLWSGRVPGPHFYLVVSNSSKPRSKMDCVGALSSRLHPAIEPDPA